jgi:hypothetical protein
MRLRAHIVRCRGRSASAISASAFGPAPMVMIQQPGNSYPLPPSRLSLLLVGVFSMYIYLQLDRPGGSVQHPTVEVKKRFR